MLVVPFMIGSQAPVVAIRPSAGSFATVLVSFERQPGEDQLALITGLGGKVIDAYHVIPTVLAAVPENALSALTMRPGVVRVERDRTVKALGQGVPWGVDKIGATEVQKLSNRGTGVKVAILDSGIDLTHPDLKIAGQKTFVAGTTSAQDDYGHGTMVAGIIAARDNGIGVVGIAPEASIYAVKVLDSSGSGKISDIINGLQWAIDNGMQVVNMSFGGGPWPRAGEEAIIRAGNAGIVLVAGAGSEGNADGSGDNISYPASYNGVIPVGAVDQQLKRLSNSGTGMSLEMVAPGEGINTTARGGGYGLFGETSAATAHVSGAAALLIDAGVTNNLEIRRRLRDTALDLGAPGWDPQYGKGLVNVYKAISFQPGSSPAAPYTRIILSGDAGSQGWYRSDVRVTLQPDGGQGGIARTEYSLDNGATWNLYTASFVVQKENGAEILARSRDKAGNEEGPPNLVRVKIDKTPPTVTLTATPAPTQVHPGFLYYVDIASSARDLPSVSGLVTTNLKLVDPYGVYNLDYGPVRPMTIGLEDWVKPEDQGRTYSIVAAASDGAGNTTTKTTVVTVTHKPIPNPDMVPPKITLVPNPKTFPAGKKGATTNIKVNVQVQALQPYTRIAFSSMKLVDESSKTTVDLGPAETRMLKLDISAPDPVAGRSYTIIATATDTAGSTSTASTVIMITPKATPTVAASAPAKGAANGATPVPTPTAAAVAPPKVLVAANAAALTGAARGTLASVGITASASAIPTTLGLASTSLKIIDSYGTLTQDLVSITAPQFSLSTSVDLESWVRDDDTTGRVYTIIAMATDKAGKTSTATTTVTVKRTP